MREVRQGRREVGQKPEPSDPGSGANRLDRQPNLIGIQEPREVDTTCGAERVESPRARIHIKQFVASISRVTLIFDFDQAMITNRPNEPLGQLFNRRGFRCFDVGRRTAKFARVLAKSSRRQRAMWKSVTNKSAPGILFTTI